MYTQYGADVINRFLAKIDFSGECWEWQASKAKGYGHMAVSPGAIEYAHRIAWELFFGDISTGLCVCHTCDNPACVNPAHLWLGTHNENMADMANKERSQKTRLSRIDVLTIRYWLKKGLPHQRVADVFKMSRSSISDIAQGRTWSHVQ